jgi:hypothetical protein
MGGLTKDQILQAHDLKTEEVPVPEWEQDGQPSPYVLVRCPTAKERDEYEHSLMEAHRVGKRVQLTPNFHNAKARMAVKCIVDEEGNRIFSDLDAEALGDKSASALNRIVDVIERLAGITEETKEGLRKNSLTGQSDDSSSD